MLKGKMYKYGQFSPLFLISPIFILPANPSLFSNQGGQFPPPYEYASTSILNGPSNILSLAFEDLHTQKMLYHRHNYVQSSCRDDLKKNDGFGRCVQAMGVGFVLILTGTIMHPTLNKAAMDPTQ